MGSRDYIAYQAMNKIPSKKVSTKVKGDELSQTEMGRCIKSGTGNLGSTLLIATNEPSQALYRIQEHIRKSVPQLVERRIIAENITEEVSGSIYDTEYAIKAVNSANGSLSTFKSINDNLKNAVHLAQQIQHLRSQRPSMYNSAK